MWIESSVLKQTIAAHAHVNSASATLTGRFAAEAAADVALSRDRDARALTRYINGFWRWPWRRELHVWEVREPGVILHHLLKLFTDTY